MLNSAWEVIPAGPLDQFVQFVFDSELVGLGVPDLPRGNDEALPREPLEDLLDCLEAQTGRLRCSIETVCFMLPTKKAWSRTRASGLLKTEDSGPAVCT